MLADLLPAVLKPAAKAVAAFLVVLLASGLAWLATAIGVEIPYDPAAVERVIVAILLGLGNALVVYVAENKDP